MIKVTDFKSNLHVGALAVVLAFCVSACGSNSNNEASSNAAEEAPAAPSNESNDEATEEASAYEIVDGVIKIVLNSNDQMQFDLEEIRVKAGVTIELTLNHTGELPKETMGHNFVLLAPGTDIATYAGKAFGAKDNDYVPEGDETIAYTKMLGGGESDTITFTAPAAGEYDFICSFPGHFGLMYGKFIATP